MKPAPNAVTLASVEAALAAGDPEHALSLGEALIAQDGPQADPIRAARQALQAVVEKRARESGVDEATAFVTTYAAKHSWCQAIALKQSISLNAAALHASKGQLEEAAGALKEWFNDKIRSLDMAERILGILHEAPCSGAGFMYGYASGPSALLISAACMVVASPSPAAPLARTILWRTLSNFGAEASDVSEIRELLLRHDPDAVSMLRSWLGDSDLNRRSQAMVGLRTLGKLDPASELRFHVWGLVNQTGVYAMARDALAALTLAANDPAWPQRKAAAAIPAIADIAVLGEQDAHSTATLALIAKGFADEIATALPRWCADTDPIRRWNAWQLAQATKQPTGIDPTSFHAGTLLAQPISERSAALSAALAYANSLQSGSPAARSMCHALQSALLRGTVLLSSYSNPTDGPTVEGWVSGSQPSEEVIQRIRQTNDDVRTALRRLGG